jgi:hypothetical protein
MNSRKTLAALAWLACTIVPVPDGRAGEGHEHGDEAPAVAGGPALPRFTAVSETFELVGVVNGRHITLYLDRYADGSPVKDARLELELGGTKIPAELHAEGEFEAELAQELAPGLVAVAATVIAGTETDLLAGELDVHEAHEGEAAGPDGGWKAYAGWAAAAGLGGFALLALGRRLRSARNPRSGGVA